MEKYNESKWIGQKYNLLTVIEPVCYERKGKKYWYWRVKCDCGNETVVRPNAVIKGRTKTCGNYNNHKIFPYNKSHCESHTRLHNIWCGMNNRCNPSHLNSERYGKRGISICDEWRSYEKFAEWARANGYKDGLSIERIDVNGNYSPENCTWITMRKQARNRRTTYWVEYQGKKMSLAEACERAKISYKEVFYRIKKAGWTFEKAISTPIGAEIGQRESAHNCIICGKEFTSHSCRSKYCTHECYLVYRTLKRHDSSFLPANITKGC